LVLVFAEQRTLNFLCVLVSARRVFLCSLCDASAGFLQGFLCFFTRILQRLATLNWRGLAQDLCELLLFWYYSLIYLYRMSWLVAHVVYILVLEFSAGFSTGWLAWSSTAASHLVLPRNSL
jgi:hypothetical protein